MVTTFRPPVVTEVPPVSGSLPVVDGMTEIWIPLEASALSTVERMVAVGSGRLSPTTLKPDCVTPIVKPRTVKVPRFVLWTIFGSPVPVAVTSSDELMLRGVDGSDAQPVHP